MTKLATPTPFDRLSIRSLAARVVESVKADEPMAHGLDSEGSGRARQFDASDAEDLIFRLCEEVVRLSDAQDKAAERIAFCLRIYKGYRIESRGPAGCMFDAMAALRPDVAEDMASGDMHDVYEKHWPEELDQ